jgi:hypothetical protein
VGPAFGLYVLWVVATYLLEGRPRTLLRPGAGGLRLTYTLIANVAIGTLGAVLVLRWLIATRRVTAPSAGFATLRRSLLSTVVGLPTGGMVFAVQSAPPRDPMVLLNGFAQVLPVSIAEVLVCWSVVGAAAGSCFARRSDMLRHITGALVASLLFGVYHVAHSPPFDTPHMVARLTVVGVATSLVFSLTRSVYGTVAFHNGLALLGVLPALAAADGLRFYESANVSLLVTGLVALGGLIAGHVTLRGAGTPESGKLSRGSGAC